MHFSIIGCHQRCLGVRFLYPVYYVPEVEILPIRSHTSVETLDRGSYIIENHSNDDLIDKIFNLFFLIPNR